MSTTATENGNLQDVIEGRDLKAIIKNVDSKHYDSYHHPHRHYVLSSSPMKRRRK
jgi:hypothetical protein